jgi:hypothetical protein
MEPKMRTQAVAQSGLRTLAPTLWDFPLSMRFPHLKGWHYHKHNDHSEISQRICRVLKMHNTPSWYWRWPYISRWLEHFVKVCLFFLCTIWVPLDMKNIGWHIITHGKALRWWFIGIRHPLPKVDALFW